jgi:hypothetical protein
VVLTINRDLQRLLHLSLQPYCYHVGATAGNALMQIWAQTCTRRDDFYVRSAIREAIERFLPAYLAAPRSENSKAAIDWLALAPLPIGAATSAGVASAVGGVPGDLPESIHRIGTVIVQEFVWKLVRLESQPAYQASVAVAQAVELAVLCAGISAGVIRGGPPRKRSGETNEESDESDVTMTDGLSREAADARRWITVILAGTCDGPIEGREDPYRADARGWDIAEEALSGAAACMFAVLGALEDQPSVQLKNALEWPVSRLCEMADELKLKVPDVEETHVYIRHVRLIGAWLWGARQRRLAFRLAVCVAASTPDDPDDWQTYRRQARYPESNSGNAWQPPIISTHGQMVAPFYIGRSRDFMSERARRHFDQLIERIRAGRLVVPVQPPAADRTGRPGRSRQRRNPL